MVVADMDERQAISSDCAQAYAKTTWCPLNQVRSGARVVIRKLRSSPEVSRRLRELGICEDQVIRLLNRSTNIVCLVCNARLALNARLAETILVEPLAARDGHHG
jgi:Fe2+ transport system protein FeoA